MELQHREEVLACPGPALCFSAHGNQSTSGERNDSWIAGCLEDVLEAPLLSFGEQCALFVRYSDGFDCECEVCVVGATGMHLLQLTQSKSARSFPTLPGAFVLPNSLMATPAERSQCRLSPQRPIKNPASSSVRSLTRGPTSVGVTLLGVKVAGIVPSHLFPISRIIFAAAPK